MGVGTAVTLLVSLGSAGCSSDPYEDYCGAVEEHREALSAAVAENQPDALLGVLPQLRDLSDRAPRDIADEWQQVVGRLDALATALEEAGVEASAYDVEDPPEDLSEAERVEIEALARELVRPETAQAFASIEVQVRDVCHTPLYL